METNDEDIRMREVLAARAARDTFTEEEIAEAQAEIDAAEIRKHLIQSHTVKEYARLSKLARPTIELNSKLEHVIYYLNTADSEEEIITRVIHCIYTNAWTDIEWYSVIKDVVNILCSELSNSTVAKRLSDYVEEYKTFSVAKQEHLLIDSITRTTLTLPAAAIKNKNKI